MYTKTRRSDLKSHGAALLSLQQFSPNRLDKNTFARHKTSTNVGNDNRGRTIFPGGLRSSSRAKFHFVFLTNDEFPGLLKKKKKKSYERTNQGQRRYVGPCVKERPLPREQD